MESTIKHAEGGWGFTAKILQPTDDEYYVTTVIHPSIEPGDIVEVEPDDGTEEFEAVVLANKPVVTLSPEVEDAF